MTTNSTTRPTRNRRTAVWVLVLLCAAANLVVNTAGLSLLIGSGLGLVTVVGVIWLVRDHLNTR